MISEIKIKNGVNIMRMRMLKIVLEGDDNEENKELFSQIVNAIISTYGQYVTTPEMIEVKKGK